MIATVGSTTEAENAKRWDGRPGFFEVWYAVANDPATRTAVWIRSTLKAPTEGAPRAAAWFAFFDAAQPERTFAMHRWFPIEQAEFADRPFAVRLPASTLRHDGVQGSLEGGGHRAAWDLRWQPSPQGMRYLPAFAYHPRFPASKVVTPNPSVAVQGTVTVDGRTIAFAGRGAQSHLWGPHHPWIWSWHRCAGFAGRPEVVLEGLVVRPRRFTPLLCTALLWIGDERIALNQVGDLVWRNRGRWRSGELELRCAGRGVEIVARYRAPPERVVRAVYQDPDGSLRHCHNSEVADCRLTLTRAGRSEELTADGCAHFEYAEREPDPRVERVHQELG